MTLHKMRTLLFSLLLFFSFKQTHDKIVLKTRSGNTISVISGKIYFNKRLIREKIDNIIYNSKYNRLIEQNSSVLLFLEIDGRPNLNRIAAYKITPQKAVKLVDCVYNDKSQGFGPAPFTDMDNDGKLEFGGFDLTEYYDSKDSMYYIPSKYYKINNGTVEFDYTLTKRMDIKVNGIYFKNPLDKNGYCCVVIKKPKKTSGR